MNLFILSLLTAWGFHAHKLISKQAVYALPAEISGFYKSNIDFIEKSSVRADIRKFTTKEEAPRHYIDLEYYFDQGHSLGTLQNLDLDSVLSLYTQEDLKEWGVLPWQIQVVYHKLVHAFKQEDHDLILGLSSDLSHYLADAHVPLHTTKNYDGQMTGQEGIHSLWETQIPEKYSDEFVLFAQKAEYIDDVKEEVWQIIEDSHLMSINLLDQDRLMRKNFDRSEIYQYQQRGKSFQKMYSERYITMFHQQRGDEIEMRMKQAIKCVADFWLTAWIEAGQPELSHLRQLEYLPSETYERGKERNKD